MSLESMGNNLSEKEKDIEYIEIQIRKEELLLQQEIQTNKKYIKEKVTEKISPRKIEKLPSGRIRLPYDWKIWNEVKQRDFILEKKWDKALIWIKEKWKDWKRYTKDNTSLVFQGWKPIHIELTDKNKFNTTLANIVNKYTSINKNKISEKWNKVFQLLKEENKEEVKKKISLKQKPIDLWYKRINSEKKINTKRYNTKTKKEEQTFPSVTHAEMIKQSLNMPKKIVRCLRRKSITDAVEDRYNIPRWLLMALISREGSWDPTIPNVHKWKTIDGKITISKSDWWVWLIHTQPYMWYKYWLKIIKPFEKVKRYKESLKDFEHWDKIREIYRKTRDLKKLSTYDDRRHPVMWLDAFARMLISTPKRGKDKWFHMVNRRVWWWKSHVHDVFKTWAIINKINNEPINYKSLKMSNNIINEMQKAEWNNEYKNTKKYLNNMRVQINWYKWNNFKTYYKYFDDQCENYELKKYIRLGKYKKEK